MQHARCEGCNVDIILDLTCASLKLDNMDKAVVQLGIHEEFPTHRHRRSQDTKAGSLDMDGFEDFHRRLSLDDVDPSHFSASYCDRMRGIELDQMKVKSAFPKQSTHLAMNDLNHQIHSCWPFDRTPETQCSPSTSDGRSCSACRRRFSACRWASATSP
jgi:hypothetical protein